MEARAEHSRLRFLLDEQISGKVADRMQRQGHDVVAATADPLLRGLGDPEIFEAAQQQERIVVTYNRSDFEEILRDYSAYGREHHGLVLVQHRRFPSREFNRLATALAALDPPKGGSFVIWLQS